MTDDRQWKDVSRKGKLKVILTSWHHWYKDACQLLSMWCVTDISPDQVLARILR